MGGWRESENNSCTLCQSLIDGFVVVCVCVLCACVYGVCAWRGGKGGKV